MASSRSAWAQSSTPTKVVAGVVVIGGFVLLFSVEYLHGNNPGLPGSIFFALFPSVTLAVAVLFLSVGLTKMRQEHISWYKQQDFFLGIEFVFLSFTMLMILGSFNNILPHLLALSLGIVFAVLAFICVFLSIFVNQVNRRS